MNADDWNDLARLAGEATPGPWFAWDRGVGWLIALDPDGDERLPEGLRTDLARSEDAEFIAAANPATILRLIEQHAQMTTAWQERREEHHALAARLAAVEALADEWERTEAYRCTNAGECPRCLAYQSAVIRLRRAALAAPTDTTKEN